MRATDAHVCARAQRTRPAGRRGRWPRGSWLRRAQPRGGRPARAMRRGHFLRACAQGERRAHRLSIQPVHLNEQLTDHMLRGVRRVARRENGLRRRHISQPRSARRTVQRRHLKLVKEHNGGRHRACAVEYLRARRQRKPCPPASAQHRTPTARTAFSPAPTSPLTMSAMLRRERRRALVCMCAASSRLGAPARTLR